MLDTHIKDDITSFNTGVSSLTPPVGSPGEDQGVATDYLSRLAWK